MSSQRWLVVGGGVSGLGAARFLAQRGDPVRVSERGRLAPEQAAAFLRAGVELRDGGHDLAHLNDVTHVVVSPGLPPTHPLLVEARRRGLPLISEIDLALATYTAVPGRHVIAVTGTNGKSTTCAMIGHLLTKLGKDVAVGGNFGDPPTAMLADGRAPDYLVLELSSYQLEQSDLVAPSVAVFTSFSFDHLARHGSLAGYLAAKWRVFAKLPKEALALVPASVLAVSRQAGLPDPVGLKVVEPKVPSPFAALGIHELHNQLNATFAVQTVEHLVKTPVNDLVQLLADFRGLPHRCEVVGFLSPKGGLVVNDSKSTNVESTLVALQSQKDPVILMMGGQGKGEPYAPILTAKGKIAALVTFGATGPTIAHELESHVPTHAYPTLKAALAEIGSLAAKYGPKCGLLFSPGCASFDEFDNYGHRGDVFKAGVASIVCETSIK